MTNFFRKSFDLRFADICEEFDAKISQISKNATFNFAKNRKNFANFAKRNVKFRKKSQFIRNFRKLVNKN